MSKKISLKQFLMRSGRFDKVYDCIEAVKSGKVTINGKSIPNPNYFFNPKKSLVKIDGEKIRKTPYLYFLMNKPAGYLSQKSPNEKSIYDLLENLNLPKYYIKSISAIGRLDKGTEGLLILTNDGKFSNIIMHPQNEIVKKYYAALDKPAETSKIKMLEKGIEINIGNEKYKTKPCKIKITGEKETYISVTEGKKRQIRKMFDAIGNKVVYLKRVSIGGLQLGNLKVGEIKQVTREEIIEKLNP
jgi:16S rRNA pseudouridine516 synthase